MPRRRLQPNSPSEIRDCLSNNRMEKPLKMKHRKRSCRRNLCDRRTGRQIRIDEVDRSTDPVFVFRIRMHGHCWSNQHVTEDRWGEFAQ